MSDHSLISFDVSINKTERGKCHFKMNNSLLLQTDFQEKVRNVIKDTTEINKSANPNTLWEIIKGSVINETIKYVLYKKKENNKKETKLRKEINEIRNNIIRGYESRGRIKEVERQKSRTSESLRIRN